MIYSMAKHYPLLIKALLVSLILHYLFVMYFPLEWWERLSLFGSQFTQQQTIMQRPIEMTLVGNSKGEESSELSDQQNEGEQSSNSEGGSLSGIDKEKWGDLLERLEENTGFAENFSDSYDNLLPNSKVSGKYIHRDRRHEDIVVKEVFPTIHNIDKPFENILKAAPEELSEFEDRNEIIEQFRSQDESEQSDLTVKLLPNVKKGNLGPLNFPPEARQKFFDSTLKQDKTEQLSNFVTKYFLYDPNKGDLPIATRELYTQNLERLLYTFSSDPTYLYLDFYLENLNKEEFLQTALYQASKLNGTKTATELLLATEAIYEIQQRAWKTFFDFEKSFQQIPPEKRKQLRIETLRRVNERYQEILQQKGIKDLNDLEKKYRQRRLEIINHIIKTTPESYRMQDALFNRGILLWEMGLQNNDEDLKRQAINQWQVLINEVKQNNYSETQYPDFINLQHMPLLDALITAYQQEPDGRKAMREKQISDFLAQRHGKRLSIKREREAKILWPER